MMDPFTKNKKELDKQVFPTVIVSRPGVMRQSLRATLGAYPFVWVMASAGDGLTAMNLVRQHQPRLLVIDSNLLDEEIEALLTAVKAIAPNIYCLVCSHSWQRKSLLLTAGADAVILRSSSGQQWQETLLQLTQPATP